MKFIDAQERFEKEWHVHKILKHPSIIEVYDFRVDPQTSELYLICEYANGGSLADHLQAHGPLPEPQAIRVALDICAALEELWAQGFVHRDIKPANILLVKDAQGQISAAKLADFGVAKDLDRQRAGQPTTRRGGGHPGTPEYMAPEQADITKPVDVRTDLYALGICLWELLTGQDYKLSASSAGPPALHAANPQASAGIAEVINRAVQAEPADRYATPRAMCADLQDVLSGRSLVAKPTVVFHPQTQRRRARAGLALAAAALAALLLAAGAYWLWLRAPQSIERESESSDESTVGATLARSAALDAKVHGQFGTINTEPWSAKAGYVAYKSIYLARGGHWSLKLRYSKFSPSTVPIQIFLDDEPAPRALLYPLDQGGWDTFAWTEPVDLGAIPSGLHSIRFATDGQAFGVADLDRFVLTPGP